MFYTTQLIYGQGMIECGDVAVRSGYETIAMCCFILALIFIGKIVNIILAKVHNEPVEKQGQARLIKLFIFLCLLALVQIALEFAGLLP